MKLITIMLISMFYIGCGGNTNDGNQGDLGGPQLSGDGSEDLEGQGGEDFEEEELQEGVEVASSVSCTNDDESVSFTFYSGSFECNNEGADNSASCVCEVFLDGESISYALRDVNWCGKKKEQVLAGQAVTVGEKTVADSHVGMECVADEEDEEEDDEDEENEEEENEEEEA